MASPVLRPISRAFALASLAVAAILSVASFNFVAAVSIPCLTSSLLKLIVVSPRERLKHLTCQSGEKAAPRRIERHPSLFREPDRSRLRYMQQTMSLQTNEL